MLWYLTFWDVLAICNSSLYIGSEFAFSNKYSFKCHLCIWPCHSSFNNGRDMPPCVRLYLNERGAASQPDYMLWTGKSRSGVTGIQLLTLAGPIVFLHTEGDPPRPLAPNWARALRKNLRGGDASTPPRRARVKLELCGKNGRVGRYKTQRLIPKFKISGQPVTSQVRSMTQISDLVFSE